MDLSLNDDQKNFKKLARDFLDNEVVPYRTEWDRAESVDTAIIPKMGEIGFFGLTIPEEYGGIGGDYITYCIGMEELGRADSSVRGIVSVSMGLVGKVILSHGTEEQKQEWLPGIANVTKLVSAFLVPTDTPGFECREIKGKLGLRGQATAELSFDDVRVPASAMLGEEGQGFKIAMYSMDKGRVSVAAGCVGIIQGCLESVVSYSKERQQFGRPLASFQLIQDMIADISVDADAARLLTWRAADLIERGEPFSVEASKAKLFASEAAVRAANLAIQAFGGYGYVDEYPVQKYMRD